MVSLLLGVVLGAVLIQAAIAQEGGAPSAPKPEKPRITGMPADPTNATSASFVFASPTAGVSYECSLDGAAFAACASPRAYAGLAEGEHRFDVRAVLGTLRSASDYDRWTVDTTPPPPPTLHKTPDDPNTKKDAKFELKNDEGGVDYECSIDGAPFTPCKNNPRYEGLSPGTHDFCARAVDRAGNRSPSTCFTWRETTDPGLPYTISGDVTTALYPGGAAQPIDVVFSNPNAGVGLDGSVKVSSLVVAISAVTGPNITPSLPCTASDFALTQFGGAYPFYVPSGSSSLSLLGFASSTWPTLQLLNRPVNQDGCKNATITLSYTGAP